MSAAQGYRAEKETFSRLEIVKKINEIKYLSSQKKVPKLTLRKELLQLEQKLGGIFELERLLVYQKKKESTKVKTLKKEITSLKQRLTASGNTDLLKKVEKLSHLIGESLAGKEVKKEVKFTKSLAKVEKKQSSLSTTSSGAVRKGSPSEKFDIAQIRLFQERINALKHELNIHEHMEKCDPEKIERLQEMISNIENKFNLYTSKGSAVKVKHTLLFDKPVPAKVEKVENLPLPPPPKMEEA